MCRQIDLQRKWSLFPYGRPAFQLVLDRLGQLEEAKEADEEDGPREKLNVSEVGDIVFL